ncbi:hypothetical protein HYALB_00000374 [Hymenoscyphus albidus]|uniref:OPT family small oligopeptide transporter n=1 Tax=Hymenoscyphus albidus TaxID=595503 RepID=A0A9N9Q4U6_9HELO|nr:hypothetical protein HYALB_00000374 [Hymenoscyphus albidus]
MVSLLRSKWLSRNHEAASDNGITQITTPHSAEAHDSISENEKSPQFQQSTDLTARVAIPKSAKSHQWDPNLAQSEIEILNNAETGDLDAIERTKIVFAEESPYKEIRAAVTVIDSGGVANTLRAWILGMLFVTVGSGLNMFLSLRSPAISFPAVVVQLLVFPIGCFWAKVVPTRVFNTFGVRWTFNTGPFTIKEHAVITLMSNVSIGYAYSTDALLALKGKPYYNLDMGWVFQLLFTISSQITGIAISGILRRFVIWPSSMIWPGVLSSTSLFFALHDRSKSDSSKSNGWVLSRYRWFVYVTLASFAWYWIPGVLFQGLSVFAFISWIKPNDVVLNQLFGGFTGLSLIPITFDWTYVSGYLGNPLLAPAHAHLNTLIGLVVFVILSAIGISYTGSLYAEYLPINTSSLFDNTQSFYNVTKILTPHHTLDVQKYKKYSPVFLAPTFALNYGLSFAALTAAIIHTIIFHGSEVWYRFRAARDQEPDVHMKAMKKYKECPDWWYLVLLVIAIALGLATVLGYDSQMPWWAYLFSIMLAMVFVIPCCMILATTNISLALNVLSPFLAGFVIPGNPIGVMIFKVFSTITLGQAQTYSGDLKMAHYMKIPPRTTFSCQVVATIWACFVQIAVMNWALANIKDICTPGQSAHYTCPNGKTFFSSSIVWGLIGPQRMFGPGSIYSAIQYYWLLGALLPVMFYALIRAFPRSPARLLNAPVMLGAMGWLPPATPLSFSTWAAAGLTFNYWIRGKFPGWWHYYNYITAAGLDTGLVLSTIIIFFAIVLPNVTTPQWWGNVGVYETTDYLYTAIRKTLGEDEKFGPAAW